MLKRLMAVFFRPKNRFKEVFSELNKLREELEAKVETNDPLSEIVHFFDVVSRWHDRGVNDIIIAFEKVNYGQYDHILEKLRALQGHFVLAGRNPFGWNRTEKEQDVTEDNVYLGNIYGLFTKTVNFWKKGKYEKKGGWGFSGMEHLNAYDVVSGQARSFMLSHTRPMIKIISEISS